MICSQTFLTFPRRQGKLEEEQKLCKEEKSKVQDVTKAPASKALGKGKQRCPNAPSEARDELQGTLKAKEAEFNKQAMTGLRHLAW